MKGDLLKNLAMASRILEMEHHGDMTLGHLSARDPDGRGFWMKRNAIGLGEVSGPGDFILLSFDGQQLDGTGRPHSEWPIHSQIFLSRSDIQVVAHTHPFHAGVFSASDAPLQAVTLEANYFSLPVPRYDNAVALIKTVELGDDLAAALGDNFAVLMANHGVTFCGTSVEHATMMGIFLEKACKAQLAIAASGLSWSPCNALIEEERRGQIMTSVHIQHCWRYYVRKLQAQSGGQCLYI